MPILMSTKLTFIFNSFSVLCHGRVVFFFCFYFVFPIFSILIGSFLELGNLISQNFTMTKYEYLTRIGLFLLDSLKFIFLGQHLLSTSDIMNPITAVCIMPDRLRFRSKNMSFFRFCWCKLSECCIPTFAIRLCTCRGVIYYFLCGFRICLVINLIYLLWVKQKKLVTILISNDSSSHHVKSTHSFTKIYCCKSY